MEKMPQVEVNCHLKIMKVKVIEFNAFFQKSRL
jgi:hypothetical protein